MKKKRNLIIAAVVIAVLAVLTIVVSTMNFDVKDKPQDKEKTYKVYSAETDELLSVNVKTADSEITAVNTGKSEWTINDLPIEEIDTQKAYSLAATVSTVLSKNEFEADNLEQYGLDNPEITVTITKKNGDSDKLYVGDMSPTLGEYFIMLDGQDKVYTLYSYKVDTLLQPVSYYKDFNRFKIQVDDITRIRIEREDGNIEIKLLDKIDGDTNNVWEMTEPYVSGANDDYIDNKILAPIESIELTNPIDKQIMEKAKLTITVKPFDNTTGKYGEEYTEYLTIGETEGDVTYVGYKDKVYTTPSQSVSFVNESAFNIVSKLQALVDISLVKSVDLEYDGKKHTIGISKERASNKYSFTLDGKETDSKAAQEIYRNIIGLAADAVYTGADTGETVLKITFNGINSKDDTVVDIKDIDGLNCVVDRNGKAEFTIKKSKVDEFIKLFDTFAEMNK